MRTLPEKYLSEIPLAKEAYEVDLAVLDRYQTFSAELLRLALLGLAGYGFLITNLLLKGTETSGAWALLAGLPGVRLALAVGAVALSFCAMCALGHRFYSTDAIAHHVRRLRILKRMVEPPESASEREDLELRSRREAESLERDLSKTKTLLVGAAVLLVVGALCVAGAFAAALFLGGAAA